MIQKEFDVLQEEIAEHSEMVKKNAKEILSFDNEDFYGEKRLSKLSFKNNGEKEFRFVFDLVKRIGQANLSLTPPKHLQILNDYLVRFIPIMEQAKELDLDKHATPKRERDRIISEVSTLSSNLLISLAQIFPFVNFSEKDFSKITEETERIKADMENLFSVAKNKLDRDKNEIERIVKTIRDTAAETGVSQNAIHFSNAEKKHQEKSKRWLSATVSTFLFLMAFVVAAIFFFFLKKDSFAVGYEESGFIVIAGMLIWAVSFCRKNYNAEKHNEVVNASRARVLATFKAFVDGTEDVGVKNTVLMLAGQSTFLPQKSGYLHESGESLNIPAHPLYRATKELTKN